MTMHYWWEEDPPEPTEEERYNNWLYVRYTSTNDTAERPFRFQSINISKSKWFREVVPGLIKQELVGIQPISRPIGLIHSLRFGYASLDSYT